MYVGQLAKVQKTQMLFLRQFATCRKWKIEDVGLQGILDLVFVKISLVGQTGGVP